MGSMMILSFFCVLFVSRSCARLMYLELNATDPAHLARQMDNQHIVIVGDSLLRYQYLSLIYLIHYGEFYPAESVPSILGHNNFRDWYHFYNVSNSLFAPYESCDCFRQMSRGVFIRDIYENRYYRNKERNISISYIQYFGDTNELHGHWAPTDSADGFPPYIAPDTWPQPFKWQYPTVQSALSNIASKLQPKPSALILNAGHWGNNWADPTHRESVLSLALSLFDRVVWKTTNFLSDGTLPAVLREQSKACTYPDVECLDLEWTGYLKSTDYIDGAHFQPNVYTDLNIQLIYQLVKKKSVMYKPMDRSFYGKIIASNQRHYVVDNRGVLRPVDTFENTTCTGKLARTKMYVNKWNLLHHILGEKVPDICTFEG